MKLKIRNLNRLIDELSGREIDLFLYLVKRQNDFGQVDSIYYKDALIDLCMPKSTFYGALKDLTQQKPLKAGYIAMMEPGRKLISYILIGVQIMGNTKLQSQIIFLHLKKITKKDI